MPATDQEIREWTDAIKLRVPEAMVVGVIREGNGLLLHIERNEITADDMRQYEKQLLMAGADGWTWHIGQRGARIRVHMGKDRAWAWAIVACAIGVLSLLYFYDIHSR